jgi:hypothetical protein
MGNAESDVEVEVEVSTEDDSTDTESYVKQAAIYWTRIAKKEGFRTAFVGTTAARCYGSTRIVSHLEVLIEQGFKQDSTGEKLEKIIHKHADELVVGEGNNVMVKVSAKRGVIIRFFYADDEENWTSLVPASESEKDKYDISVHAVATYSEQNIGYEETIPVQFAPNLLISKLRGFGYKTNQADRTAEMRDIDAVVEWMIVHNCRYGVSGGLASRELPSVRTYLDWCHWMGYHRCDIKVVNKWRQLGFPLKDEDILEKPFKPPPPPPKPQRPQQPQWFPPQPQVYAPPPQQYPYYQYQVPQQQQYYQCPVQPQPAPPLFPQYPSNPNSLPPYSNF